MVDETMQHPGIEVAEALEAVVETSLKAAEKAWIVMAVVEVFRTQKGAVDDRDERP